MQGLEMMRSLKSGLAAVVVLLAGCGGGGCGSELLFGKVASCGSDVEIQEEFTAAASPGELVKYTINKSAMTYSYEIIASAYGLVHRTKSGRLLYNAEDDTYSPQGLGSKIAFNSDGLFFGVIQEDFGAGAVTVPVFGLKYLEKDIGKFVGYYNFISYQCIGANPCTSFYGSLIISTQGQWQTCRGGNFSDSNYNCVLSDIGLAVYDSASNKIILKDLNGNRIGTAISYVKNAQKVFIVDLDGGSPSMGKGMVVASSQSDVPSTMDGTWRYVRPSETGRLVIQGTDLKQYIDGGAGPLQTRFLINTPWKGFVTTPNGTIALAAGSGMYAAKLLNGDFSVGLKQ
jgi:hypothetical protein